MFKPRGQNNRGFTLIELLIVIMLLGILAAGVITVIDPNKQRLRAQDGVLKGTVSKIGAAIDAYYAAKLDYPTWQEFRNEVESESYSYRSGNHYMFTMEGVSTGNSSNRLYYGGYNWQEGCVSARGNENSRTFYVQAIRKPLKRCTISSGYQNYFWAPYYMCASYLAEQGSGHPWWRSNYGRFLSGSCTTDI